MRKRVCCAVVIGLGLIHPVLASVSQTAETNLQTSANGAHQLLVDMPKLGEVFVRKPKSGSYCYSSWSTTYAGAGDKSGNPYELKYLDHPKQHPLDDPQWEIWHRRLAETLNNNFATSSLRVNSDDRLVVAECTFRVSQVGKIDRVVLDPPSLSEEFNLVIEKTVKALEGTSIIQFPNSSSGPQREFVFKTGRFVQNYGPQFLKLKGEAEK